MDQNVQCIIAGGGLVGPLLGLALAQGGMTVAIIDRQKKEDVLASAYDGRVSAISYGSQKILQDLGVWEALSSQACPILHIRISDEKNPAFVHFTAEEVSLPALGYMVPNLALRKALFQACESTPLIQWHEATAVQAWQADSVEQKAFLENGLILRAPLGVGAEGRGSSSRQQLGVKTWNWSYEQVALVGEVHHTLDHEHVAHEHFRPEGPLALLPLVNPYASSLVWSLPPEKARHLLELPIEEFSQELEKAFGPFLGTLTMKEPRWSYPLSGHMSRSFQRHRFAWVGDAAHGMHPVAGQAFNVGIYDAYELARIVLEAFELGLDWGESSFLKSYERRRRLEAWEFAASTHGVVSLFSSHSRLLRKARQMGMDLVQHFPFLKKQMIRHASRF